MARLISILLACRKAENASSQLPRLLESLFATAHHPNQVEVLIKFDDDDKEVKSLIAYVEGFDPNLRVFYKLTPRGAGYFGLHHAYNDLLNDVSTNSELIWVVSDDCEFVAPGWDAMLLSNLDRFEDRIFVLHHIINHHQGMSTEDVFQTPDPYPIWSRKWVEVCGGFGPCTFTDAWTGFIEHLMITRSRVDRRIQLPRHVVRRSTIASDRGRSKRFDVQRSAIHSMLRSPNAWARANALSETMGIRTYCTTPSLRAQNLANMKVNEEISILDSKDAFHIHPRRYGIDQ